jgi:hypothetical protein
MDTEKLSITFINIYANIDPNIKDKLTHDYTLLAEYPELLATLLKKVPPKQIIPIMEYLSLNHQDNKNLVNFMVKYLEYFVNKNGNDTNALSAELGVN